jgi:hypothetical protein|tara:strand:- start:1044 stop:1634 length:591 start_codon:yes stop_codon:yes gene_type:complete
MSQFERLENTFSPLYNELKSLTLSADFPWFYNPAATPEDKDTGHYQDIPFYSHTFLARPKWLGMGQTYYPVEQSIFMQKYYPLLEEIIDANNLNVNSLLRFNANCVHPSKDRRLSIPHNDHPFPHKNILIYFTDAGGETVLIDEDNPMTTVPQSANLNSANKIFYPVEDDIVLFEGLHCMRPPVDKRRIVLVATFF